jgi:hypothetical protein
MPSIYLVDNKNELDVISNKNIFSVGDIIYRGMYKATIIRQRERERERAATC